jgi:hypothetical protein
MMSDQNPIFQARQKILEAIDLLSASEQSEDSAICSIIDMLETLNEEIVYYYE